MKPTNLFGPASVTRSRGPLTRDASPFGQAFAGQLLTLDAATSSGLAFLQGELEKIDPKIRQPLTNVTWMRDMPVKTGGGFELFSSVFFNDFGSPDNQAASGTQSNVIPMVEANLSKDIYPLFVWKRQFQVDYIDQALLRQVGRSLESLLNDGVRLGWQKWLDNLVYIGITAEGITGLVNNTALVTASTAAAGASGLTDWAHKTPNEILDDVNTILEDTYVASEYDPTGMANHVLLPPNQWKQLSAPMTVAGADSIMEYLKKKNIYTELTGNELGLFPSRWCASAGTGSTDRMVAYVNDEDRVYYDQTVPLTRIQSYPFGGKYVSIYAGQAGQVKVLYPQTIRYLDGI